MLNIISKFVLIKKKDKKMDIQEKIWAEQDGHYYLTTPSKEHKKLENRVYTVRFDERKGLFYLIDVCEKYTFDYKIYGLETKLINRVLKTYESTSNNLGLLLNGVKGTGKTVSSKIISNKLNQPTIVITIPYKGVQFFINSIPQDITIFVDEYEKIYGQSNELLTIMDGAMNSDYRRMFLLTTNKLYIEDNLKQRPSRLRYLKKFTDLIPDVVEEIVDDILINKDLREDCLKFITTLSLITVDIVKSILSEVNIHNESPFEFGDVFNVNKIETKYKIIEMGDDGNELELLADKVNVYPRPNYDINDGVGCWFEINGKTIGRISEILSPESFELEIYDTNNNGEEVISDVINMKIETSYGTHSHYSWGDNSDVNRTKTSDKLKKLLNEEQRNRLKRGKKCSTKLSKPISVKMVEKSLSQPQKDEHISLDIEFTGAS